MLTPEQFLALSEPLQWQVLWQWAHTYHPFITLGYAGSASQCPLACYLKSTGPGRVYHVVREITLIDRTTARPNSPFLIEFAAAVDTVEQDTPLSAGDVLGILGTLGRQHGWTR